MMKCQNVFLSRQFPGVDGHTSDFGLRGLLPSLDDGRSFLPAEPGLRFKFVLQDTKIKWNQKSAYAASVNLHKH